MTFTSMRRPRLMKLLWTLGDRAQLLLDGETLHGKDSSQLNLQDFVRASPSKRFAPTGQEPDPSGQTPVKGEFASLKTAGKRC